VGVATGGHDGVRGRRQRARSLRIRDLVADPELSKGY
jgi:hypothetical protein